jgi:spore coat polysaccharide biosynthesis predicted glycosyltransferase SpsG
MAKIVFTWELGSGMGHIMPYLFIVKALQTKGHEVNFILKDLSLANLISETCRATCFQAPIKISPVVNPIKEPLTYAHILHNIGFDDLGVLNGMVEGWRALFNAIKPDLVIFEHSPTALLAARGYAFKKIHMGGGFTIPAHVYPLPNLRLWLKPDPGALRQDEDLTLATINKFLDKLKLAPLNQITDLFATEPQVLCTLEELDPYKERKNGNYYGAWMNPVGEKPLWPDGQGEKIFAYLKPFPTLPSLLSTLIKLKAPSIVYINRISDKLKRQFSSSPTLRFTDKLQDLSKIAAQCDFAILNATLHTTINLLLSGKPALHLPLYLEQWLTGHHVANVGAGINEPTLKPDEMAKKLDMLIKSDSYTKAAQEFSNRYKHMNAENQNDKILALIFNMLQKKTNSRIAKLASQF